MLRILYVCTHNRCRSILSESITNSLSDGKLKAFSAGSSPTGEVHPLSLRYLQQHGYSTEGLKSKSWDAFAPDERGESQIDVVVTVCDQAASEACPVWFGNQLKLHWGLADPSKLHGTEEAQQAAFDQCIAEIEQRVHSLLALDTPNKQHFYEQLRALIGGTSA